MSRNAAAPARAHPLIVMVVLAAMLPAWPWSALGFEWFAAPSGSPGGAGTLADPWDIGTALTRRSVVQPGDTVWLRGGTYYHADRSPGSKGWNIDLAGSAAAPIVIRNYNGERATIDGGLHTDTGSPQHLRVWGLEVIVSENFTQTRVSTNPGSGAPPDLYRPWGGIDIAIGQDIRLINNVIHDNTGNGIGFWKFVGEDSELYGNIISDNGWIGPDRYHGPGIYTQNVSTAHKYILDNIVLENYSLPMQAYGSSTAPVDNYVIAGNTFRPKDGSGRAQVLCGGEAQAHHFDVRENAVYRGNVQIGYNGGIDDVQVIDNSVSRGTIYYVKATNVVASGNFQWPTDPTPSAPIVSLRPNRYEPDRANLTLLSWAGLPEPLVDFGGFLAPGDGFELKNPKNFFGPSVYSGTYLGAPVEIPMGGSEFQVYVVFRRQLGAGVPEPGALALLAAAALQVWLRRRR